MTVPPTVAAVGILRPASLLGAKAWVLTATVLTMGGWMLSLAGALTPAGYGCLLGILFGLACGWQFFRWSRQGASQKRLRLQRFRQPAAMLFLLLLAAEAMGGLLYEPTNYDGLTYRVPRILHWLQAHGWHWIGGWNSRMDYSAVGYEWLMAPILALGRGERLLFLPNLISLALLPGLVFSAFRGLGVAARVARFWMWILPCGYSLVLQAGSIGNDSFAVVFLLACLAFSRRAHRFQSSSDAWLALLSMGLLTGAKASNLPLLLPCMVAFWPAIPLLLDSKKHVFGTVLAIIVSTSVSFVPMAAINWHETGDWTGDPANEGKMKLAHPVSGLAGNALQLAWENLQPSILFAAADINKTLAQFRETQAFKYLSAEYPRCSVRANELASEEASGLGLGLTVLLAFLYARLCVKSLRSNLSLSAEKRIGFTVGLAGWVALLVFMAKLGSEAVPRIATPYYPLLFLCPLLAHDAARLIKKSSFRWTAWLAAASVIPAVIFSPARPLFPTQRVVAYMEKHHPGETLSNRMKTVYEVYARRSDIHARVREQLPHHARVIGFAGTGDDSELSFWRPLGRTVVRDLPAGERYRLPNVGGVDVIVTYEEACRERYSRSVEELVAALGWQATASVPVQSKAAAQVENWIILVPPKREIPAATIPQNPI